MLELFFLILGAGILLTAGAVITCFWQAMKFDRWSENQSVAWFCGAGVCFIVGALGTSYLIIKVVMSS